MRGKKLPSTAPRKILVIVLRYLGDVLLTTPVIRSLRQAYPDVQLDVLLYGCTASMLEGNPDVDHIIATPNRPNFSEYLQIVQRIFRRYDLSITIQTGDRPFVYNLLASSVRIAVVPRKFATGWWKRYFLRYWLEDDNVKTHTVLQHLKLLDLIGVPNQFSLVPPHSNNVQELNLRFPFLANPAPFIILHPLPQFNFKRWTVEGWLELGYYFHDLGFRLVLSGGPIPEELEYIANLANKLPEDTVNLAGKVSVGELTHIIEAAKLFVGPDTGITHLAAATGIPVISLYGPTNPVKWAPWPSAYHHKQNPFENKGTQHVNNVYLVQGEGSCVPCHKEGCDRHRNSHSLCLDKLSAELIKKAATQVLATPS